MCLVYILRFLFFIALLRNAQCFSLRGDMQIDEIEQKKYSVGTRKLSRDDFVLSDPHNASLYFNFPQQTSQTSHSTKSSGRSTRALDLDVFLGDATKRQFTGTRQSRILNDDKEKSNLAIQGFIPIVTIGKQNGQPSLNPPKIESSESQNPDPYTGAAQEGYAGPEDAKYIGAALQNFAATLAGKPKRKYGYDYQNIGINKYQDCICVPFYMCKNGFLESPSKNAKNYQTATNYEESLAIAQSELNKHAIPAQLTSFYEQQKYFQQQDPSSVLPLVDERSIDGSQKKNESTPQYVTDVLTKIMGRSNDGLPNCGVFRTCCRVISDYVPEHSSPEYIETPVYQPQMPNYYPPQNHGPNLPFLRPQTTKPYPNYIHPSVVNHKPHGLIGPPLIPNPNIPSTYPGSFRPINPNRKAYNLVPTRPQAYDNQLLRPQHIPSLGGNHIPVSHQSTCGVRHAVGIHGRVQNLQYHESSTEFGEYPWQVAILKRLGPADSLYVCGGTLISEQWIATAAHCIKKNGAPDLKVRLGEWDVHREDEFYPFVEKYIEEIIVHPQFFAGNLVNDIALLRLDSPVDLSLPHVATACLPERHENFAGHRCWVTGWGKDSFGHKGTFQSVLKEVDVPITNRAECEHVLRRTRLGPYYELHPGFMCAGGEPGKDACEGDGGSPLVCDVRGVWKAVGLVSWGIGCGQPGVPGVYVNMAYYRDWIDAIIQKYDSLTSGPSPYSSGPSPYSSGAYSPVAIVERSNAQIGNATEGRSFDRYSIENYRENSTSTSTVASTASV